jgi:hypothetical protein
MARRARAGFARHVTCRAAGSSPDSHCGWRRLASRHPHDDRSPALAASAPRLGNHRTCHRVVPRVFGFRPVACLTGRTEWADDGLRIRRRSRSGSRIDRRRYLEQRSNEQRRSDVVNDDARRHLRMSVLPRCTSGAEPSARCCAANTTRRSYRADHAGQRHAFSAPPTAGTRRLKGVVCPRSSSPAGQALPASDVDSR